MKTLKYKEGDEVRIWLYGFNGAVLGSLTGKIKDCFPNTDVSNPGEQPRYKTLYEVEDIVGYERPHEDDMLAQSGMNEKVTVAVFAETDMTPIDSMEQPTNPIIRQQLSTTLNYN